MILVDTSVWIDHLRRSDAGLARLLNDGRVLTHPFIIGEIALGGIKNRREILDSLVDLPRVASASDEEALAFIDAAGLPGSGGGYLDAHLLASVRLTPGTRIWTRDRKLNAAAIDLDMAFQQGN
jgi:predicted nucleic acid-binding protein